jgi:hypothetical protein
MRNRLDGSIARNYHKKRFSNHSGAELESFIVELAVKSEKSDNPTQQLDSILENLIYSQMQ